MFLVQSLKMFKPSNGTDKSTTHASSKNTITISLFLKSPWAADVSLEQKFQQLHHQLSELYLDEQTSILLSLLSLFESTTLNELEHLGIFKKLKYHFLSIFWLFLTVVYKVFLIDYSNESSQSEASQHKKVCFKDKCTIYHIDFTSFLKIPPHL